MQWLRRMNALLELLFQSMLSLRRQIRFVGFLAGELRQDRQFVLQIFAGNSVPKSVFKREHVHLLLLDAENLRRRKLNKDLIRANCHGHAPPPNATRPELSDFDIGPSRTGIGWTLGVGRFLLNPKKYRPPRPMGVKGGCSPQNNRKKLRC